MAPEKSFCAPDCELRCALQQLCRLALRHVHVGTCNSRFLNPALQQPDAPFECCVLHLCRFHALNVILQCSASTAPDTRNKAVRLTANRLYPEQRLRAHIVAFAQKQIALLHTGSNLSGACKQATWNVPAWSMQEANIMKRLCLLMLSLTSATCARVEPCHYARHGCMLPLYPL